MYLPQTESENAAPEAEWRQARQADKPSPRADLKQSLLYWSLLVGVGAFLVWRILVVGIAEHYARDNPEQALAWEARHPLALRNQGASLFRLERESDRAEYLMQAAIRQNPSDARAYALLALFRERAGELEAAYRLMERASALGPRLWPVQLEAAAFWLRHRQLERAVQSWNVALQMNRQLAEQVFPVLLKIAERSGLRQTLFPVVSTSPEWWPRFFAYAAANGANLETLRALYEANGDTRPSDQERQAFLARLQEEGYWVEAYFTWLDALDEAALKAVGNLFNGHFEQPLMNEGFGWHVNRRRGVEIDVAPTYGVEGERALRVAFSGQRVRFQHLSQPLLLSPGTYQLTGKARLDNLDTTLGLQWAMYCLAPVQQPLAASERFLGASQWRRFNFLFEVPQEDCTVQLLRLELLGQAPADFEARGVAWFDTLGIERVREVSSELSPPEEQEGERRPIP